MFSQKKGFLIFFQKKAFLIFPEMKPCIFWSQPSNFFPKKFLIFFPRKIRSEKISYIFSKESFSYISGNEILHFSAQALRIKKIHPDKISYASGNGDVKKTSYIFVKRKFFLYFGKREPRKNSLYFRKRNFC